MYRPDEMAMILEQAKQYTNSQRLGYTEKKVVTWDGNTEGKASISNGEYGMLYKVSDDPIEITKDNLKSVTLDGTYFPGEAFGVMSQTFENDATMTIIVWAISEEQMALVMVADKDVYTDGVLFTEKGVYFASNELHGYTQAIELETIHPIPQEYIPPLDRLVLNGTDGKRYALSVDSSGQLVVEEVTA